MYPNTQLPGSLWYHDHSMGSTGFNVKKGLSGMYLIRNSTYENIFPTGDYEKILLISLAHGVPSNTNQTIENDPKNHTQEIFFNNGLKSDAYYRFRILNSDYDGEYNNIRFQYKKANGSKGNLNFTIIAVDSAILKYHNDSSSTEDGFLLSDLQVSSFEMASAERVDLLIKFPSELIPVNSTV